MNFFDKEDNIIVHVLTTFIKQKSVKIVGGLISKIAFSVIGNQLIEQKKNSDVSPFIGRTCFNDELGSFAKENIRTVIYFHEPSTGYCVGNGFRNAFTLHKGLTMPNEIKTDYGNEIEMILRLSDEEAVSTIAFCCDFVSLDYIRANGINVDDPKSEKDKKKIVEIEDWIRSSNKTAMFTGILSSCLNEENKKLVKAFLYAIDKNLYELDKKTNHQKSTDLFNYFKTKLNPKNVDDKPELIKLLTAYRKLEGIVKLDDLIYFYVYRLTKWKSEESSLYYKTIKPKEDDIKEIFRIRLKGHNQQPNQNIKYSDFIDNSFLEAWKKEENEIKTTRKKWRWKLINSERNLLNIVIIFIVVQMSSLLSTLFDYKWVSSDRLFVEFPTNFTLFGYNCIGIYLGHCLMAFFAVCLFVGINQGKRILHLKSREKYIFKDDNY